MAGASADKGKQTSIPRVPAAHDDETGERIPDRSGDFGYFGDPLLYSAHRPPADWTNVS